MRVVHISTDDYTGGASIAAFRLHSFMLRSGIESSMLVRRKVLMEDTTVILYQSGILRRLRNRVLINTREKVVKYNSLRGLFSYPVTGSNVYRHNTVKNADVIYLHWTNRDYLSVSGIKHILQLKKPVFWVLHDMWAMTGGCHHSFDCDKYTRQCSMCPHLQNTGRKDLSNRLFKKKKKIYDQFDNLEIITPSQWLGNCAKKSVLLSKKKVHVIPNVLDLKVFKPNGSTAARELFNLPLSGEIILFGAIEGTQNPYKGWSYLYSALHILSGKRTNLNVLILGVEKNKSVIDTVPFPVYYSGILHDNESICMLYNAADIFIAPSLADNLPNTIVESLSCGTPVVGFKVGGIPDLVKHMENGYVAEYKDSNDLARGINWALDNKVKLRMKAREDIAVFINRAESSSLDQLNGIDIWK